jgi:hypothetical protein
VVLLALQAEMAAPQASLLVRRPLGYPISPEECPRRPFQACPVARHRQVVSEGVQVDYRVSNIVVLPEISSWLC